MACAAAVATLLAAAGGQAARAQPAARVPAAASPASPATSPASSPSTSPVTSPSALLAAAAQRSGTELRVIEDDQIRIEETRVRGQLQRVTVAPKGSTLRPYEINVGTAGRDPSQDKSAAGQRVWSVLRF